MSVTNVHAFVTGRSSANYKKSLKMQPEETAAKKQKKRVGNFLKIAFRVKQVIESLRPGGSQGARVYTGTSK